MDSKARLKILFITGATHKSHMKNLNHFQRVYFLSREANLSILGVKNADFSISANPGTKIHRSHSARKIASLVYFFYWILTKSRKENFDIVITEPSLYSLCGFWARMALRTKWVVDIWDIPIRNQSDRMIMRVRTRSERWILKILFRKADLFIVSILPDYELKYFRLPEDKTLLLKNAIWLDDLPSQVKIESSSKDAPFDILCMRSVYTAHSGLDILGQAYQHLCKDLNVSLTIVGRIPPKVSQQLTCLDGCPSVNFLEFIQHEELLKKIRDAAACVIPYKNVPDLAQIYPVKLLEYMASGRVVIAPDMGGFAMMIQHRENGLLFEPGDAEDLICQIKAVYEDRELVKKISSNAKEMIKGEYACAEKNKVILSRLKMLAEK
jgi:glycosyltransferase involved in cell wall biosynthesis